MKGGFVVGHLRFRVVAIDEDEVVFMGEDEVGLDEGDDV